MSERAIENYKEDKLIVNISDEDLHWLKKYARKLQHLTQGGNMVNCPICSQPSSLGPHWMTANNISVVCTSKHLGNRRVDSRKNVTPSTVGTPFATTKRTKKTAFITN